MSARWRAPGAVTMPSRYSVFHALAVAAVLTAAISRNFWHNFIHGGFPTPPRAEALLVALASQLALMLLLLLAAWGSTFLRRRPAPPASRDAGENGAALAPGAALAAAARAFLPITLIAFALEGLSLVLLEHVFALPAQGQDLVAWLKPDTYPLGVRLVLMGVALLQAPLLEEALFRGIVFRGLLTVLPFPAAMLLSGFLFAVVHVNAATLLPLWFLGCAFAWLYWRTHSLLAPMTAHLLFNLTNLVLLFTGVAN